MVAKTVMGSVDPRAESSRRRDDLTEGQQWRHSQSDPGGNRLGFDPERDPGHDDDQRGRYVSVEQVIAQSTAQIEHDLDAREVAGRVLDRAVGRVVVRDVQLRKLDLGVHHQRVCHVPDEH